MPSVPEHHTTGQNAVNRARQGPALSKVLSTAKKELCIGMFAIVPQHAISAVS